MRRPHAIGGGGPGPRGRKHVDEPEGENDAGGRYWRDYPSTESVLAEGERIEWQINSLVAGGQRGEWLERWKARVEKMSGIGVVATVQRAGEQDPPYPALTISSGPIEAGESGWRLAALDFTPASLIDAPVERTRS